MSLSYHFTFSAPASTPAAVLEDFLHDVEVDAKALGFDPVLVLDAAFDTPERQKFARQLTTGARLESDKLKGVVLLRDGQVWNHDAVMGSCRVIPKRGVVLVVTDKQRRGMCAEDTVEFIPIVVIRHRLGNLNRMQFPCVSQSHPAYESSSGRKDRPIVHRWDKVRHRPILRPPPAARLLPRIL